MGHQDKDQDRMHQTGTQSGQTGQTGTGQSGQTGTQTGQTGQGGTWQQDRPQDWKQGGKDMEQGDKTRPAQPDGTKPLERDQQPMNQNR